MSETKKKHGTEDGEKLPTYTTAAESANKDNSSKLVTNEPIARTPFRLCGGEEIGYFITWGHYRLTEPETTTEKALLKLDDEAWMVASTLAMAITLEVEKERLKTMFENKHLTKEEIGEKIKGMLNQDKKQNSL